MPADAIAALLNLRACSFLIRTLDTVIFFNVKFDMQPNTLLKGLIAFVLFVTSLNSSIAQDADLPAPADSADLALVAKNPYAAPLTDAELRRRLGLLSSCLQLRPTGVVKGYIRTYSQIQTLKTRGMLGKRMTYFPLFEEKLKEYGLPADLKYLAVVESALNAKAVSRVGATGLWQFMPYTGNDYGLYTNSAVEDRSNPVKSTDAAARYLRDLFKQYNDWALALAAYNSGPSRVNAAIKRAHSRDFWQIQRYLPEETRNYVPAFIAATYICNFYMLHDIEPVMPSYDEQMTDYLLVYEGLSFRDIAEATGVEYNVIKALNPGFRRDYVPPSAKGHFVVLPQRVMMPFVRYLNSLGGGHTYTFDNNYYVEPLHLGDGRYWQKVVTVQQPDMVDNIAKKHNCHPEHLKGWNKLGEPAVKTGQKLTIWYPVFVQKRENVSIEAPADARTNPKKKTETAATTKPAATGKPAAATAPAAPPKKAEPPKPPVFQWHTIQRNESLDDIARKYDVTPETIRKMNPSVNTFTIGTRLRIKQI